MIITTTPNIEGDEILEYFNPIIINKAANVVDVMEWFIGIQDSNSALREMEKLKEEVLESMKKSIKFDIRDANAIVGFSMDYDQIGGKSGGMLMVSAVGTPVKVGKVNKNLKNFKSNSELILDYYSEQDKLRRLDILVEIKNRGIDENLIEEYILEIRKDLIELTDKEIVERFLLKNDSLYRAELKYRDLSSEIVEKLKIEIKSEKKSIFEKILVSPNFEEVLSIIDDKISKFSNQVTENVIAKIKELYENKTQSKSISDKEYLERISKVLLDAEEGKLNYIDPFSSKSSEKLWKDYLRTGNRNFKETLIARGDFEKFNK